MGGSGHGHSGPCSEPNCPGSLELTSKSLHLNDEEVGDSSVWGFRGFEQAVIRISWKALHHRA